MTSDSFVTKPSQTAFQILPQWPEAEPQIEDLLDRTFGPERQEKTVYRLRAGVAAVEGLSFVAVGQEGDMIASIRFWPVSIAGEAAILLGPLAVEPKYQGQGMGRALVSWSLKAAKRQGHRLCLVVGDPAYYAPYGFVPACPNGLILPGPVEPERFQVLELVAGGIEGVRGLVEQALDKRKSANAIVA